MMNQGMYMGVNQGMNQGMNMGMIPQGNMTNMASMPGLMPGSDFKQFLPEHSGKSLESERL